MDSIYTLEVAGLKRELPVCRLNDSMYIAGFVIFGDVELTVESAKALNAIVPDYDYALTAESKGIPLIHEMARQSGRNKYFLARKMSKLYMKNPHAHTVKSITTAKEQTLYLDQSDFDAMKGKRILLVDDVISTGESIQALEDLALEAGATIAGRAAILAEGEAGRREDIIYLEKLPTINADGSLNF